MVWHRISLFPYYPFSKRFLKKWLHCFFFLIFSLKENCFYYLGEAAREKQTSLVCLGWSIYYKKEYLQKTAKIYEFIF